MFTKTLQITDGIPDKFRRHNYIQVTEQHQILELDAGGNVWLSLGIIDISPDQSDFAKVNFKS